MQIFKCKDCDATRYWSRGRCQRCYIKLAQRLRKGQGKWGENDSWIQLEPLRRPGRPSRYANVSDDDVEVIDIAKQQEDEALQREAEQD